MRRERLSLVAPPTHARTFTPTASRTVPGPPPLPASMQRPRPPRPLPPPRRGAAPLVCSFGAQRAFALPPPLPHCFPLPASSSPVTLSSHFNATRHTSRVNSCQSRCWGGAVGTGQDFRAIWCPARRRRSTYSRLYICSEHAGLPDAPCAAHSSTSFGAAVVRLTQRLHRV